MAAEATHQLGQDGVFRAKAFLERLLTVSFPFTAYEAPEKLLFAGFEDVGVEAFSFDMKGFFQKPKRAVEQKPKRAVEVYVEVKTYSAGASLLAEYDTFCKRAVCAAMSPEHASTWFVFFCTAPFGTTVGEDLCNGKRLRQAVTTWPERFGSVVESVSKRITVIIATPSFSQLVELWAHDTPGR